MIDIHELGLKPYLEVWEAMKTFTAHRNAETNDQLWLLEHEPVYTQGQAGKAKHLLGCTSIPVIQSDRGGQITYHGPGQLMAYCLLDLKRHHLSVKTLVNKLEETIIQVLQDLNISSFRQCGAPGIYVDNLVPSTADRTIACHDIQKTDRLHKKQKIASIGLRIKQGCCYHGIALNVNMDLKPFQHINPCGFEKLRMSQILDFIPDISIQQIIPLWIKHFLHQFEG